MTEKKAAPAARFEHACRRCSWRWFSKLTRPSQCPHCFCFTWDRTDLHCDEKGPTNDAA